MLTITEKAGTPICIEDDLLDEDTLFELQIYMRNMNNGTEPVLKDNIFYQPLMKIFKDHVYHHRFLLKDRVQNKRSELSDEIDDCVFQIFLRSMGERDSKPHRDNSWKILSSIMYVGPDKSIGTIFLDSETSEEPHEVEWKPNRIVSMIPSKTSWHTYKNYGIIDRHTVQFILANKENYKEY